MHEYVREPVQPTDWICCGGLHEQLRARQNGRCIVDCRRVVMDITTNQCPIHRLENQYEIVIMCGVIIYELT